MCEVGMSSTGRAQQTCAAHLYLVQGLQCPCCGDGGLQRGVWQEEEKNRKLNDLLDALDFNQVRT